MTWEQRYRLRLAARTSLVLWAGVALVLALAAAPAVLALDLIFGNHFSPDEPGIFEPIRDTLLAKGDYYMHLADLTGYVQTQQRVAALYGDRQAWAEKAIHNVARSGKFSSDRTIFEYARDVWQADRCPVE